MSQAPILAAIHSPRLSERRLTLEDVFSASAMESAWDKYLRKGFRSQPVLDLYDYFDFHRSRKEKFARLRAKISAGIYEARPSLISRLEKKNGLCRPVVIPTPEDAIVLQCITEALFKPAIKAQPAATVFFSRSHSSGDFRFSFGRDYIWFRRWRKFAKIRFQIASTHEWVVVTDVANYFDTIIHSHLRNQLANLDGVREPVLDILFRTMPFVSWNPDYLPFPPQGIPQVQFDAPRLLAHVYLYEIDKFLRAQTGGNFVRWVDDITAAVRSKERGIRLVRDLDAMMHTRGIRLNSSKTRILSKSEAFKFFHTAENEIIDALDREAKLRIKKGVSLTRITSKTRTAFKRFISKDAVGHSDKVARRYISLFAELESDVAVDYTIRHFVSDPDLRETAMRYFFNLGPRQKIFNALESYLKSGFAVDDVSVWQIGNLFTQWEVSPNSTLIRKLRALANELAKDTFLKRSPFYFLTALWIMTKYGTPSQLAAFLKRTDKFWETSDFFARQVAAASSRFKSAAVRSTIVARIRGNGLLSAESVINDLRNLRRIEEPISKEIRGYLLNGKNHTNFGLPRVLIIESVLRSKKLSKKYKVQLRDCILEYLTDPVFVNQINAIAI